MTKKHHYYQERIQFYKFQGEMDKEHIEPNNVYSIYYELADVQALNESREKHQWGIIITNAQGEISMNYNLNQIDRWDLMKFKLTKRYHVFSANSKDKEFALNTQNALNFINRYNRLKESFDTQHERMSNHYKGIYNHWLHRFANRLINLFS